MRSQKPFIVRGALVFATAILGAQVMERRQDIATKTYYYSDILSA